MDTHETMKNALQSAIQFEKDGIEYYQKAEREAVIPYVKKVFAELVVEEREHIRIVKQIYDKLLAENKWIKGELSPTTISFTSIFKESPGIPDESKENDLAALEHAANMEEKGSKMYQKLSEEAKDNTEKEFYNLLSNEEVKHRDFLLDSYEYLKDPSDWGIKHGKSSLDGA